MRRVERKKKKEEKEEVREKKLKHLIKVRSSVYSSFLFLLDELELVALRLVSYYEKFVGILEVKQRKFSTKRKLR